MFHDIAIDIRGLSKCFNGAVAVDNVTFTVRLGEVFGFMGHNGAGKTRMSIRIAASSPI